MGVSRGARGRGAAGGPRCKGRLGGPSRGLCYRVARRARRLEVEPVAGVRDPSLTALTGQSVFTSGSGPSTVRSPGSFLWADDYPSSSQVHV